MDVFIKNENREKEKNIYKKGHITVQSYNQRFFIRKTITHKCMYQLTILSKPQLICLQTIK